jgi:hypothetical protein
MRKFSTLCALICFLAAIMRPAPVFAADLDLLNGKITTEQYLRALSKRSFCNKAGTVASIRDEVKLKDAAFPGVDCQADSALVANSRSCSA